MAEHRARPDRLGRHPDEAPGTASCSPTLMESSANIFMRSVSVGTDLALAIAHALVEEVWLLGLLVGLYLLLGWLKLPPILFWALILFLVGIMLLCREVLFL
jgi:hypothetical protein